MRTVGTLVHNFNKHVLKIMAEQIDESAANNTAFVQNMSCGEPFASPLRQTRGTLCNSGTFYIGTGVLSDVFLTGNYVLPVRP